MRHEKFYIIIILVLTLSFSTQAFASLTFTSNVITGTTASSIDLGAGNDLSLQTTGNGAINLGSGLLTSLGSAVFGGNLGIAGTVIDDSRYINLNVTGIDGVTSHGGYFSVSGNGGTLGDNETSLIGVRGIATRASGEFTHGAIVGVLGNAYLNSGISTDNMASLIGETQNIGGDINQAYGVYTNVLSYTSTAHIDTAYGVYSDVNAITNATISDGRALYGRVRSSGGGAITNAFGLYLENITAGTSNNYAIYSLGGKSYLAGNLGIGKTSPGSKLSVVGLPAYANNAAALAGGLTAGDFYYTDVSGEYIVKITH